MRKDRPLPAIVMRLLRYVRGEALDEEGYLQKESDLTPENLRIFSLWLGKEISIPKNFDAMAQGLQPGQRLIHLIPLEDGKKVCLKAEPDHRDVIKSTIEVVTKDEAVFKLADGLYMGERYGEFRLAKAINFQTDEKLEIGKLSDLRQLGFYLTGKNFEAGEESKIKEALIEKNSFHIPSEKVMTEIMDLMGILPKEIKKKDAFSPSHYYLSGSSDEGYYGSERYIACIRDVCEMKREKDQKMVRVATLTVGDNYSYKIGLLVVDETLGLYNYLDKGRLIRQKGDERLDVFIDRDKDALLFTWADTEKMSEEIYSKLTEAFERQIPDSVKDDDDYEGFDNHNKLDYKRIFSDDPPFEVDKRNVGESFTLDTKSSEHRHLSVKVVDKQAVYERLSDIHQHHVQEQLNKMETMVAHHLKSTKSDTGERIALAGGIILEKHTIDIMGHKIWMEYRSVRTDGDTPKTIEFKRVKGSQIFEQSDMTTEVMDLETVMKRIHKVMMHNFTEDCYHQPVLGDKGKIDMKEGEFKVHFNDVVMAFEFTRTQNGAAMMKINGSRVGMENVERMLNRLPCFVSQKEFDAFVDNIAEISFAAHDLLNEGQLVPPFRFRFKREGRNWYVKKNDNEWVTIPGGFRAWTSMAIDTYYFTDTIRKFAEKLKVPAETMVMVLKTARAEYAVAEQRAKKLMDDTIVSLKGRAKFDRYGDIEVRGTSGMWYKVEKESLKVYALGRDKTEATYVCIVDSGANVNKTDRLVSRILSLANDTSASEQITTLKPHINKH